METAILKHKCKKCGKLIVSLYEKQLNQFIKMHEYKHELEEENKK